MPKSAKMHTLRSSRAPRFGGQAVNQHAMLQAEGWAEALVLIFLGPSAPALKKLSRPSSCRPTVVFSPNEPAVSGNGRKYALTLN
jgi:hypothetical protein